MVRTLIFFFILMNYVNARGELSLSDHYLSDTSVKQLSELAKAPNINEMLKVLKKTNPSLKIIIVDLEIVSTELSSSLISWRDDSVLDYEYDYYKQHTQGMIQSVGYYIAPDVELKGSFGRPLKSHPLMVIKDRMPMHGLLHEVVHFLIDDFQRSVKTNESNSEDINFVLKGVGNEVFVDAYLLSHLDLFNFEEEDVCFRQKYLNQNLQVMKYLVSELEREHKKNKPEVISELYNLYSQAYLVSSQFRMDCLLLPYSKSKR